MYFSIPNLRSDSVTEIAEPWNYEVPEAVKAMSPDQFKAEYSVSATTRHAFLSFAKGQNPAFRVTKDNEIVELHGFFGDYDGVFSTDMINRLRTRPPSNFYPTWWIRTVSGGLRLAWEFESPIRVSGNGHAADLLKHVASVIKAVKWGSDFDQKSKTGFQYMDVGREWNRFSDNRISRDLLESWAADLAVKRARVYSGETVTITAEKALELCREKFGDRVREGLRAGSRCRRFWDAESDNDNGCVITDAGVFVFVPHDKPFMSWTDILGHEAVEEYTAKQVSPMLRKCFYCPSGHGGVYWRLREHDGAFVPAPKTTFVDDLLNLTDISPDTPKGGTKSPMDEFLFKVREEKAVDCAAPILYAPSGAIELNGQTVLNISRVVALAPAARFPASLTEEERQRCVGRFDIKQRYVQQPDTPAWDNPFVVRFFPHIHRYLTTLFMPSSLMFKRWKEAGFPLIDIEGDEPGSPSVDVLHDRQLVLLLSWLSYFYKQGVFRRQMTQPGQALILAGGVGKGKTFFAEQIVGNLMGGAQEASDYFIDGTSFTDDITNKPVLLIDDKACDTDSRTRSKFTMRVKALVAKAKIRHHAKFQTPVEIPYRGRLIICCNDDPQSLSVLPNLDAATSDKIIMLRLANARYQFDSFERNAQWIAEELPYFARFLIEWETPEEMRNDRYGVKAFQHESMKQAVAEYGVAHTAVEILSKVFGELAETDEDGERGSFKGTATDLMATIRAAGQAGPEYIKEIGNIARLRYALKQLVKAYPRIVRETIKGIETWTIPYKFTEAGTGE